MAYPSHIRISGSYGDASIPVPVLSIHPISYPTIHPISYPTIQYLLSLVLLSIPYPNLLVLLFIPYPNLLVLLSITYPNILVLLSIPYPTLLDLSYYPSVSWSTGLAIIHPISGFLVLSVTYLFHILLSWAFFYPNILFLLQHMLISWAYYPSFLNLLGSATYDYLLGLLPILS